jgi:hypothetical protein
MPWTSIQCEFKTSQSAVRPVNYRSIGQTGTGTGRQKSRPVPSMAQAIKGVKGVVTNGNQNILILLYFYCVPVVPPCTAKKNIK